MTQALITIERHILDQQSLFPQATGAFTSLMYDIALAAKLIARETTRAGLAQILGHMGISNVHGEEQQKLDLYAHETIVRILDHTGRLCIMASEESADPIPIPDRYPSGNYALLFDPLDGSSNIDYNASIGMIFSIYRKISPKEERGTLQDLLQPGFRQVAAGYVFYGSSTMLVYTSGQGVHGFTLDPSVGEFLLSHPNMCIPENPRYYSANQGYEARWGEGIRRYIAWITGRDPDRPRKGLSLRYIGSLVADFHRNLMGGGVFLYPAEPADPARRYGKLRLCYECAPLAFVVEQAGGYASNGIGPIMNIQPEGLHQRVPFFAGNTELVQEIEAALAQYEPEWVEDYRKHVVFVERPVYPEEQKHPHQGT
jgi:fructose-1,6-bisphosphatase I